MLSRGRIKHPLVIYRSEIKELHVREWVLRRQGALVQVFIDDVPVARYVGSIGREYKLLAEAILEMGTEADAAWKSMYPNSSEGD